MSIEKKERMLAYCASVKPSEVIRSLGCSDNGLTDAEVTHNREKFGPNQIMSQKTDTVLYRTRRAFINPFSVILLVLAGISFVTDMLSSDNLHRNGTTVVIMLTMLLISGIVRFVQEMRARKIADRLMRLVESTVRVQRSGKWIELASSELVVGDRVSLSAGDRVPADVRLIIANDLFVSQSVITGESAVLEKSTAPIAAEPANYAGYTNIIFMGSAITGGCAEGIVIAVGKDTVYGSISPSESVRKNGFDRGANSIAWVLIRFMAILTPVVFIACGLTKGSWFSALLFALSVAVGLTPELLPMVINACLAKGSAAMGHKQTIVKNINAMQGFGSMDVLCVDKTGTLTGDTVILEYYMDILGNESEDTLRAAYLNSLYHTGVQNHLDSAVLKCREMPGRTKQFDSYAGEHAKLDELPFDYERRFASVLTKGADGENLLIAKGSVEAVCRRCEFVEYRGRVQRIENGDLFAVHSVVDEMQEDGMKVLAVAKKTLNKNTLSPDDESGLTLIGYLAFFDAPKQSAASAIRKLQTRNVNIRVLTGDQRSVAVSICKRLKIPVEKVLVGDTLEAMTDDEKAARIEQTTVFAELSPQQKAYIVRTLQENGHTVGFLGDGMNDLPAIVEADVGISVDTASEAVKESADVILLKKDLNVLEEGILEGRRAFSNMSKYIRITASSNFGNILSVVIASVLLPFFPMTSVQLLLLNLLYDLLCLVLPWDSVDEEELCRPAEWTGNTLGRFMVSFGPISSVFDLLTFAFLYFVLCPQICGGSYGMLNASGQAAFVTLFQTGWFLESMWTQVLILHLLRTRKVPLVQSRPAAVVMIVTLLGILGYTALAFTPLAGWIGLTIMPVRYFAGLLVVVTLYLLLVSMVKWLYVRRYRELV